MPGRLAEQSTLFLQGRYQVALSAYVEGQKRDAERNPVQASRLALCRLAAGDPEGAMSELRRALGSLPKEYKRQLLTDTSSILLALLTHRDQWVATFGVPEITAVARRWRSGHPAQDVQQEPLVLVPDDPLQPRPRGQGGVHL